jgi:hypothetical protein
MALSGNAGTFRELSAGVDRWGGACCYAIRISDGSLWQFGRDFYSTFTGVQGVPLGGTFETGGPCLHVSATAHNEAYVIASNHTVWLVGGAPAPFQSQQYYSWQGLQTPYYGAVQLSAGVDQWGQDKVYMLDGYGFVSEDNHDGSLVYFADQYGWLRAGQISAGLGANTTGVDLYYTNRWDGSLNYYNGWSSQNLGGKCLQIGASLNAYGQRECYAIGTDHALYLSDNSGHWHSDGGQMTQISAAQHDMVFAVSSSNHGISVWDPNGDWYSNLWMAAIGYYWNDTGGISGNPDYNFV